jgi:hypothetical protein
MHAEYAITREYRANIEIFYNSEATALKRTFLIVVNPQKYELPFAAYDLFSSGYTCQS